MSHSDIGGVVISIASIIIIVTTTTTCYVMIPYTLSQTYITDMIWQKNIYLVWYINNMIWMNQLIYALT